MFPTQSSIWELESFYTPQDVIIAGAGLGGLWSAYYLKKYAPKLNILIVEKSIAPTGASTRNAGFACFGSLTELLDDARILGEDKMLELVDMRYQGLEMMKSIFRKKEIAYKNHGGYELITAKQYTSPKKLTDDISYLNYLMHKLISHKNVFRLAGHKIKAFGFNQTTYLIENKLEGQLHSGHLALTLLQKVQLMGVRIMTGVELSHLENARDSISLHTGLPVPLSTRQVLLCANTYTARLHPGSSITPARGQVLVTSPIRHLPFKGCFHFDEGFYYFRNLGNRVLLGGARNKAFDEEQTDELSTTETIQQALERFLKEVVLPDQTYTIEHRWSGTMGMSPDKFPIVKQLEPNIFCATGMGGIGVALAPVVGKKAAKMMLK